MKRSKSVSPSPITKNSASSLALNVILISTIPGFLSSIAGTLMAGNHLQAPVCLADQRILPSFAPAWRVVPTSKSPNRAAVRVAVACLIIRPFHRGVNYGLVIASYGKVIARRTLWQDWYELVSPIPRFVPRADACGYRLTGAALGESDPGVGTASPSQATMRPRQYRRAVATASAGAGLGGPMGGANMARFLGWLDQKSAFWIAIRSEQDNRGPQRLGRVDQTALRRRRSRPTGCCRLGHRISKRKKDHPLDQGTDGSELPEFLLQGAAAVLSQHSSPVAAALAWKSATSPTRAASRPPSATRRRTLSKAAYGSWGRPARRRTPSLPTRLAPGRCGSPPAVTKITNCSGSGNAATTVARNLNCIFPMTHLGATVKRKSLSGRYIALLGISGRPASRWLRANAGNKAQLLEARIGEKTTSVFSPITGPEG